MKDLIAIIILLALAASCASASRSPIATIDVLLERVEALEARIAKLEGGIVTNDLLYRPMPGHTLTPLPADDPRLRVLQRQYIQTPLPGVDPKFFLVPNNGESK